MVLSEDRTLERFVRECLHALRVQTHEIRFLSSPAGRGSAKQWIDREYPAQVQAHRRRGFENIALVVATDADEQTVKERVQRLADVLQEAGREARASQEQIAIWVPRWHIEKDQPHCTSNDRWCGVHGHRLLSASRRCLSSPHGAANV